MSSHALLSPSSSSRWLKCPASVTMWSHLTDKSNKFAELGTAVHELGEVCLTTGSEAEQFIGKHFNDIEVNSKMVSDAQLYVDYVRNLLTDTSELLVEERINLTMVAPETFGSSDAVVIDNGTLHIIDYKNGRGAVFPDNNSQLMLYALGAYHEHDMFYDFHTVVLHIVQPNASTGGHCTAWSLSVEDLLAFGEEAVKMANEALGENPRCVAGTTQCQWCIGKSECKTLLDYSMDSLKSGFETLDEVDVNDDTVSLDILGEVLGNKKMIIDLLKAYEERATFELEAGKEVKGFKLVESRKNKSWVNDIDAFSKLKTWFKIDEISTSKLMTPTQIGKLLGKDISTKKLNIFNAMWEVPDGKPTVAPNSDKRKAVSVSHFEEIKD